MVTKTIEMGTDDFARAIIKLAAGRFCVLAGLKAALNKDGINFTDKELLTLVEGEIHCGHLGIARNSPDQFAIIALEPGKRFAGLSTSHEP